MKIQNCLQSILIFALIGLASMTHSASAALPGDAVDDLKNNASDKLQVEIVNVEELPQKRSAKGYHKMRYTAKVTKVEASKSGVKVRDVVTINAYHWSVDFDGPANPPLLKKGWKGGILLNAVDAAKAQFKLAAYGHSFY